jgi:hypothetical protein
VLPTVGNLSTLLFISSSQFLLLVQLQGLGI